VPDTGSSTLAALTSAGTGTAPAELDLDFTAGLPSGVTYTRTGTAWYYNASGVLTSAAANAARVDYNPATLALRGFLTEPGRTQSIRNATGSAGLVAGTPGTVPTNWVQQANATGVTRTIIGTGTANGMPYVDFQYSGTATASDSVLFFEPSSGVATVNATTWTSSVHIALIAGTLTNVTCKQGMRFRAAAGANIGTQIYETTFVPTATLTRYERTATGSDATIAFCAPSLCLTCATGAVDLTLRISIPQLELGAFATSPLVSTTATLTRGADILTINPLPAWFRPDEGTFYVEASRYSIQVSTCFFAVSDGTNNNSMSFINGAATAAQQRFDINNANVPTCQFNWTASATADTVYREVAAYRLNDCAGALNGGTVFTDASTAIPTVNRANIGTSASAVVFLGGHIRRIRYWPLRQSNTDVVSLSNASVSITGTAAGTLDALTGAAAGLHFIGTGSSTLDDLTGAAAGLHFVGTGASTLDALTSAASGDHIEPRTGTAAGTLDDLTSSAAGMWFLPVTGIGSSTLDDLTSSAAGDHIEPDIGTAGGVLADLTSSALGAFRVSGAVASTLDDLDQDAAGGWWEIVIYGAGNIYLSNLTGTASGIIYTPVTGTASRTLDDATTVATGTAAGGSASTALDALSQAAQGAFQVSGAGAAALRDLDSFGFGTAFTARRVRQIALRGSTGATVTLNATVRQ
jgi:hypothetical protein